MILSVRANVLLNCIPVLADGVGPTDLPEPRFIKI